MKKAVVLFVAAIFLTVCGTCKADEMTARQKIDRAVVYAMAEQRCIDLVGIDPGEVEKYFAQVFESESTKAKWIERIWRRVNRQITQEASVFVGNPEMNLAPEPFVQFQFKKVTYTFFKSGSISYDIGDMDPEEFFSRR